MFLGRLSTHWGSDSAGGGGVGRGSWKGGDTVIPLWKHGKWVLFWQGVPHYVLRGRQNSSGKYIFILWKLPLPQRQQIRRFSFRNKKKGETVLAVLRVKPVGIWKTVTI